jgi:hypothetical protein
VGLFSTKTSSTTQNLTENNFFDQRSVIDAGGGIVGEGNALDQSNNYLSMVSNTGTDPGLVQMAKLNAEMLGAVAESQSDTVRFMAGMGAQSIRDMGGAAGDMYTAAFQNTARAWEHTLDAGTGLIGQMLAGANKTTDAAQQVAQSAIAGFQPAQNSQSDTMKWAAVAAVGLIALLLLRKA